MIDIRRLGLGTMGMSNVRNPENSVKTIHAALDKGITLFNTGEFYNASESELIVGQALKGVARDRFFLSVKFGVLPSPGGGIYGLDVKPHNVKGHLTYSMRRLGLDHIDLYQPARMDTEIPVEEVVGAIAEQVQAGYVSHIGLSMVDAETLRRAHAVHPIHTVEMSYSLVDRSIEQDLVQTAAELGVRVLAFGTIGHGVFRDNVLESTPNPNARGLLAPENREHNLAMIRAVKEIADTKGMTLSQLALAWSLAKYPHVSSLVGTTNPAHLQSAIDALQVELTPADIAAVEAAIPPEKIRGVGMRTFIFTNGVAKIV